MNQHEYASMADELHQKLETPGKAVFRAVSARCQESCVLSSVGKGTRHAAANLLASRPFPDAESACKWYAVGQQYHWAQQNWGRLPRTPEPGTESPAPSAWDEPPQRMPHSLIWNPRIQDQVRSDQRGGTVRHRRSLSTDTLDVRGSPGVHRGQHTADILPPTPATSHTRQTAHGLTAASAGGSWSIPTTATATPPSRFPAPATGTHRKGIPPVRPATGSPRTVTPPARPAAPAPIAPVSVKQLIKLHARRGSGVAASPPEASLDTRMEPDTNRRATPHHVILPPKASSQSSGAHALAPAAPQPQPPPHILWPGEAVASSSGGGSGRSSAGSTPTEREARNLEALLQLHAGSGCSGGDSGSGGEADPSQAVAVAGTDTGAVNMPPEQQQPLVAGAPTGAAGATVPQDSYSVSTGTEADGSAAAGVHSGVATGALPCTTAEPAVLLQVVADTARLPLPSPSPAPVPSSPYHLRRPSSITIPTSPHDLLPPRMTSGHQRQLSLPLAWSAQPAAPAPTTPASSTTAFGTPAASDHALSPTHSAAGLASPSPGTTSADPTTMEHPFTTPRCDRNHVTASPSPTTAPARPASPSADNITPSSSRVTASPTPAGPTTADAAVTGPSYAAPTNLHHSTLASATVPQQQPGHHHRDSGAASSAASGSTTDSPGEVFHTAESNVVDTAGLPQAPSDSSPPGMLAASPNHWNRLDWEADNGMRAGAAGGWAAASDGRAASSAGLLRWAASSQGVACGLHETSAGAGGLGQSGRQVSGRFSEKSPGASSLGRGQLSSGWADVTPTAGLSGRQASAWSEGLETSPSGWFTGEEEPEWWDQGGCVGGGAAGSGLRAGTAPDADDHESQDGAAEATAGGLVAAPPQQQGAGARAAAEPIAVKGRRRAGGGLKAQGGGWGWGAEFDPLGRSWTTNKCAVQ